MRRALNNAGGKKLNATRNPSRGMMNPKVRFRSEGRVQPSSARTPDGPSSQAEGCRSTDASASANADSRSVVVKERRR